MFLHGVLSHNGGIVMDHDQNLFIQAEMLALLENIPSSLVEKHPLQFLMHLDQIRQKAAQHHLSGLHDLACAFESALQKGLEHGSGVMIARSYLKAMREAVGCGQIDANMSEAIMADVALRLGGQP